MKFLRWSILAFLVVLPFSLTVDDDPCLHCGLGKVINAQVSIDPFTTFTVTETTLNLSISANADDGFDHNGTWNGVSTVCNVGRVDAFGGVFDGGFRFTGVNIPAGATIVSATFEVEVDSVSGAGGSAIVQGRDVNNAAAWDGTGPATMAVTTANITRTLATVRREVFDVKAIIQEIVDNNSGTGDALSIGVLDNGTPNGNNTSIETLENSGTNEATLDITYSS